MEKNISALMQEERLNRIENGTGINDGIYVKSIEGSVIKTVASESSVTPSDFDFANLYEAISWIKSISSGIVTLDLDDGIHYINKDEDIAYIINMNLIIKSISGVSANCIITISDFNRDISGFVYLLEIRNSYCRLKSITVDGTAGGFIAPYLRVVFVDTTSVFSSWTTTIKNGYQINLNSNSYFSITTIDNITTGVQVSSPCFVDFGWGSVIQNCTEVGLDIRKTTARINIGFNGDPTVFINNGQDTYVIINEVQLNGGYISDDTKPLINTDTSGDTASRITTPRVNEQYFDTTLGKPIWFNGTNWIDAVGTTV